MSVVVDTTRPMSDVPSLIGDARRGDKSSIGVLLQQYRIYLTVLASTQIDQRLQPRVSPSDVVQETMLRAHKNFGQFRGTTEAELLTWLRQILVNNLATFVEQHMLAARRDVRREVSIERLGRRWSNRRCNWPRCCPPRASHPAWPSSSAKKQYYWPTGLQNFPRTIAKCWCCAIFRDLPLKKRPSDWRCDSQGLRSGKTVPAGRTSPARRDSMPRQVGRDCACCNSIARRKEDSASVKRPSRLCAMPKLL
jgi:RNA polymerase sigma-70 factor (subfamily 1)